jgi:hypothetical protein
MALELMHVPYPLLRSVLILVRSKYPLRLLTKWCYCLLPPRKQEWLNIKRVKHMSRLERRLRSAEIDKADEVTEKFNHFH